jgi:hypothetical protein
MTHTRSSLSLSLFFSLSLWGFFICLFLYISVDNITDKDKDHPCLETRQQKTDVEKRTIWFFVGRTNSCFLSKHRGDGENQKSSSPQVRFSCCGKWESEEWAFSQVTYRCAQLTVASSLFFLFLRDHHFFSRTSPIPAKNQLQQRPNGRMDCSSGEVHCLVYILCRSKQLFVIDLINTKNKKR